MGVESTTTRVFAIDLDRLAYELGRRGRQPSDLTAGPHRISRDTLTRLRRDGVATRRTLLRIGRRLRDWPVQRELAAILSCPDRGAGSALDAHQTTEPTPARGMERSA